MPENYSPIFLVHGSGGEHVLSLLRPLVKPTLGRTKKRHPRKQPKIDLTKTNTLICKLLTLFACLALLLKAGADEILPLIAVKGQTYSNVTVTAVTATDVFFSYSNGMGNVKLKDLDPKLQAHFHFDAAKSVLMEKQEATNNALYQQFLLTNRPQSVHRENSAAMEGDEDFVAPKINARSVLGQRPPPFAVEHWLTPKPDAKGKFVMIIFWATSSGACRQSIPQIQRAL